MSEMLLMATRPGESLYAVIDDEVASDGIVVGSNYAKYVPLWGYLSRYPDFVEIDTDVHRVLALNFPDPARLTDSQRMSVQHFIAKTVAPYETEIKPNDFELGGELPVPGTGNKSISFKVANAPWKFEPYDPDAEDGDGDGLVQDGTPWERPGGTRILDRAGNEIERGLNIETRPAGARIVDADGNDVDYTPSWAGGGRETIDNVVGARPPSIAEQGARTLREILDARRSSESAPKPQGGEKRPVAKVKKPKVSDLPIEPGELEKDPERIDVVGKKQMREENRRVIEIVENESTYEYPGQFTGRWLNDGPIVRYDGAVIEIDPLVTAIRTFEADPDDPDDVKTKFIYIDDTVTKKLNFDEGANVKRFTVNRIADALTDEGQDMRDFVGPTDELIVWYDMEKKRFVIERILLGSDRAAVMKQAPSNKIMLDMNDERNQQAINRAVVDQIIHSWAIDSRFMTAVIAADAAQKMLELDGAAPVFFGNQQEGYIFSPESVERQRSAVERVVAKMYELSQRDLENEPDVLTLFRGIKVDMTEDSELSNRIQEQAMAELMESLRKTESANGNMNLLNAMIELPVFSELTSSAAEIAKNIVWKWRRPEALRDYLVVDLIGEDASEQERQMMGLLSDWLLDLKQGAGSNAKLSASHFAFFPDLGEIILNPLSAFSTSQKVAEDFADSAVLTNAAVTGAYKVPKRRVLSTPGNGFGCFEEAEMVVAGGGSVTGLYRVELNFREVLRMLLEEVGV